LEHYSSIAVYQTIVGSQNGESNNSKCINPIAEDRDKGKWWVALRVAHHSEGPSQYRRGTNIETAVVEETPHLAVSLPSGSCYYLLDDFNHHHQHTVLTTGEASTAGMRYSCTYRLLRDSHNIHDWIDRGKSAVRQFHKKGPKIWRSEQLLLTEIESEWIRQFYIQGTGHHHLLWESYWKEPMQELLNIWTRLEFRTEQTILLLRSAAEGKCGMGMNIEKTVHKPTKAERKARDRRKKSLLTIQELVSRVNSCRDETSEGGGEMALAELYQPMAVHLLERAEMRIKWEKREKDHVFHELPLDCRPMEIPLRFECIDDVNNIGSECIGTTRLKKNLNETAEQLLQLGRAYQNSDVNQLPQWKENESEQHPLAKGDSSTHNHAMDWPGWNTSDRVFGIELQHPWAGAVIDGKKQIETRSYNLPPSLIGKKIMIIESSSGKAGISSLSNYVNLDGTNGNKVIGWCTFSSVKTYTAKEKFQAEDNLHLVTSDSGYGWRDGLTKYIYGWIVGKRYRFDGSFDGGKNMYDSGVRRFRSLFELNKKSIGACPIKNKKNLKRNRKNRENINGKKKIRKRY